MSENMKKFVLSTDSRRRLDRFHLQNGDVEKATQWKRVAEFQQREDEKIRKGKFEGAEKAMSKEEKVCTISLFFVFVFCICLLSVLLKFRLLKIKRRRKIHITKIIVILSGLIWTKTTSDILFLVSTTSFLLSKTTRYAIYLSKFISKYLLCRCFFMIK
jgi:hypothetical protein